MKVTDVSAPVNVDSAIDKINLKIDYLSSNLNNYATNIEQTMNEIPKDIRSIKSMNTSSRQCVPGIDTDRTFSKLHGSTINNNRKTGTNVSNLVEDASEQTLKTILDFKSERAQTQHRQRTKTLLLVNQQARGENPLNNSNIVSNIISPDQDQEEFMNAFDQSEILGLSNLNLT